MATKVRLGIDVGGSGIKAALVDLGRGEIVGERFRVPTPDPSTPVAVAAAAGELANRFRDVRGPAGVAVPAVIRDGVAMTAANIDRSWIGSDVRELFEAELGRSVVIVNDADAAGVAEMRYGAGRGVPGTVIVCTLGTGIGSAVFRDGLLLPNTELGHIEIRGRDGEKRAAPSVRTAKKISWAAWIGRLDEYLGRLEALLWPDLFILGGGVSKHHERFIDKLTIRTPVVAARFYNAAGIIGAALVTDR